MTRSRTFSRVATATLICCAAVALPAHATGVNSTWSSSRNLLATGVQDTRPDIDNLDNPDIATSADGSRLSVILTDFAKSGFLQPLALTSADSGANWTVAKELIPEGNDVAGILPTITSSSNGKILDAAFTARLNGATVPLFTRSTDAGQTWLSPGSLDSMRPGSAVSPAVRLATSSDGEHIAVAWNPRLAAGGGARVMVRAGTSAGLAAPVRVSDNFSLMHASTPAVTASEDGRRITVAWVDDFTAAPTEQAFARAASSADGGVTWTPQTNLSAEGRDGGTAQVAGSADGLRVTAVWSRLDGDVRRVETASSSDGGVTWSPAKPLAAGILPQIAGSSDGLRLTALWQGSDGTNTRIQSAVSTDGGKTWGAPEFLSAPGQDAKAPQLAAADSGRRLTAIWTRSGIQAASSAGGTDWSAPVTLTQGTAAASAPKLAASTDGTRVAAVWERLTPDNKYLVQTASGSLQFAPGEPRGVTATPGPQTTVSWQPPADPGTSPISAYRVTTAGAECATTGTSCTLNLAPGTHTVSVTATNAIGTGPAATTSVTVSIPAKRAQTASPALPTRIKRRGKTALLSAPVITNAGQTATARITVKPKRAATVKRMTVKTKGRKCTVTLTLGAPATDQFEAYSFSKTWRVRR